MNLFGRKGLPRRRGATDLVERLCEESGKWLIASRLGDRYSVVNADRMTQRFIDVRTCEEMAFVKFTAEFPVRFSLDREPRGLFARVLMRCIPLHFANWRLDIGESCEAVLYLFASQPRAAMDARLFNAICQEMVQELRDFHTELVEKFRYGGGAADMPGQQSRGGVPMRKPWDDVPDSRYSR